MFIHRGGTKMNDLELKLKYMGVQHKDSGHSYGPVVFSHYVLQYVTEGKGYYEFGGGCVELCPGDMFLIMPATECSYRANAADPYTYYSLGVSGRSAEEYLKACGYDDSKRVINYSDVNISDIMSLIFGYLKTPDNIKSLKAQTLLVRLFEVMMGYSSKNRVPQQLSSAAVRDAIAFIEHNYIYDITAADIASSVYLNTNYFCTVFKNATGRSPKQYLIDYRIDKACYLLENTDFPVTRISGLIGFDVVNFTVRFKQRMGLSPLNYRKHRKNF